jgi:hypothetical protein
MHTLSPFAERSLSRWLGLFTAATLLAGCPSPSTNQDASPDVVTDAADPDGANPDAEPLYRAEDCDPLDESACSLPWPSNLYLRSDTTRATGYTLQFGPTSLPANERGRHPDAEIYQRLDGYGLGVPIMTLFPHLDVSAMADEYTLARSLEPNAPVLLFEVSGTTLQRVPYFVELDSQESDPARKVLFVRPAVILKEGTRYVVAFRNLHTTAGAAITPSPAFARLRDGMGASDARLAPRQNRFNEVFTLLEGAGVTRSSLTLAWDFNTASSDALHGTLLRIRDEMLTAMPMGPVLTVDTVTEYARTEDGSGRAVDANIAFEIAGRFEVPDYLHTVRLNNYSGTVFNRDATGKPFAQGTRHPSFWVRVPWSALDGTPHGLLHYGHGLLGAGTEARAGYLGQLANENHFIVFSANMTGMSGGEVLAVLGALEELGNFRSTAETLHQGLSEWVLLARGMRHRLADLEPIASRGIVIDPVQLYYSGNSQGGILGSTYMAITPEITRGHVGVPGNNFSTLLHRSIDFTRFFTTLRANYPSTIDQAIGIATIQLLWDQTDPVSYLRHVTAEPFPGTPRHQLLIAPAKGDHQVAAFTNEITARSDLGIVVMEHYDRERTPELIELQPYPRTGSAVVLWDFGNPWPAPGNHTPVDDRADPHEAPRRDPAHNRQLVHFWRTGQIIDVCGGSFCPP